MSINDSHPLFPADFPIHLRRFARHITAVQTRGPNNSSTNLLFTNLPSQLAGPGPPTNYIPSYDSYDLKNHPVQIFRPNLFVDNIERLFVSVVPLWSAAINQITRLTTWKEPSRTTSWAIVYSICWWNELVLPAILTLIICLSAWPKHSAAILFPPEKLSISQDPACQTEPEGEQVAEVAAAAAATFINNDDDHSPLPPSSPLTEVSSNNLPPPPHNPPNVDSTHSDSNKSTPSKQKETKTGGKKNLTQQYKPVIYKYGGGIQNIAGELCDVHERLRNLFTRRFIPPPPQLRLHPTSPSHPQDDSQDMKIDANVRFALPFIPLLLFSLVLSTETLGRCVTFAMGFIFFFLNPIQLRVKLVRDALDADQTILRGVPTDRAFVLATLRNMQQRHESGLDIAMKLLAKPKPPKLPERKSNADELEVDPDTLSDLSSSHITASSSSRSISSLPDSSPSSDSSPPHGHTSTAQPVELHKKLIKFAKKINRVTEQGTQLWSRATYQSLDLSSRMMLRSSGGGGNSSSNSNRRKDDHHPQSETASIKSSSKADKLLRAITATRTINLHHLVGNNETIEEGDLMNSSSSSQQQQMEGSSQSFFCYYGNMPGHLTIHYSRKSRISVAPMLTFYSGLGQSFKVRKSLIVVPLSRIVAMRKVSMLNLAGVWGGIDGIEICERRSSDNNIGSTGGNNKLKRHTFRNLSKRDEAFLSILVLKDWNDDEEPGWIAV